MEKVETLEKLHYIPIIIFVALPTTVIVTYVIAVVLNHVEAGFPYISDAAAYAPESCIFAQFINIIAALMSFLVYLRYSQIKECTIAFRLNEWLQKWNRTALVLGLLSTLGLSIVANFQETSVLVVHFIGAFMCFGCGTLYFWSQAVCSYYLHPVGCSLRIAHARLAMSVFNTICFFVILVCGILAHRAYKGKNPRKWYKEDGGWEFHVVSTAAEWLCSSVFCLYILSFTDEFKDLELPHPKITYKRTIRSSNEILSNYGNPDDNSPARSPGGAERTIT